MEFYGLRDITGGNLGREVYHQVMIINPLGVLFGLSLFFLPNGHSPYCSLSVVIEPGVCDIQPEDEPFLGPTLCSMDLHREGWFSKTG